MNKMDFITSIYELFAIMKKSNSIIFFSNPKT